MRPVISVSLSGRAYQLEDDAHAALARYLDSAALALAGNPDQAEILTDLEQAIADKLERCLGPHKTVVFLSEIDQVIRDMGPVDSGGGSDAPQTAGSPDAAAQGSGAGASAEASGQTSSATAKRLYQISDGALISGVCKGIAVYLDVDVTLVRVLFVIATVLTGGLAALLYVIMMFIVPYANTLEEHAAARGLPFNARVLVEQAKLKAAQLANVAAAQATMHNRSREARAQWKADWRQARAEWRQEWRRSRTQWRAHRSAGAPPGPVPPTSPPMPPLAHFISGLIWAALGLLAALLTVTWLFALLSLVTTGAVFGWIPYHLPLWAAVIGLLLIYQAVVWPLRAVRHAMMPRFHGYPYSWHASWDALVGLILFAFAVWYFTHHGHDLQQSFDALQQNAQPALQQFLIAWQTLIHGMH